MTGARGPRVCGAICPAQVHAHARAAGQLTGHYGKGASRSLSHWLRMGMRVQRHTCVQRVDELLCI